MHRREVGQRVVEIPAELRPQTGDPQLEGGFTDRSLNKGLDGENPGQGNRATADITKTGRARTPADESGLHALPPGGCEKRTAIASMATSNRVRDCLSISGTEYGIINRVFNIKKPFAKLGPGIITGASDDDPSGIATYSQSGAKFGFSLLWLAPLTLPMMYAVQEMSARLALVTGRGLASIIRKHISKRTVVVLSLMLFIVNVFNIGADLSAMAAATRLVLPGSTVIWLLVFAIIVAVMEMFTTYKQYVRVLRWLILALFAYVLTAFLTKPDWSEVIFHTLIPIFKPSGDTWMMIVAILGTTIAPYMFFWQSNQEVEEEIDAGRKNLKLRQGATAVELKEMRGDVVSGMALSNVIFFFIVITTATTLYRAGITNIETAQQAALALRPLAGDFTFALFALGIVGTGLIGVPILATSASFAFAEAFGWKAGMEKTYRQARPFYLTILLAILFGVLTNVLGFTSIQFLIAAAVLNGLLAPILLWYIIRLSDSPKVVGVHRSPTMVRRFGWFTFLVMSISAAAFIIRTIF